jgi:hypothetical protein
LTNAFLPQVFEVLDVFWGRRIFGGEGKSNKSVSVLWFPAISRFSLLSPTHVDGILGKDFIR